MQKTRSRSMVKVKVEGSRFEISDQGQKSRGQERQEVHDRRESNWVKKKVNLNSDFLKTKLSSQKSSCISGGVKTETGGAKKERKREEKQNCKIAEFAPKVIARKIVLREKEAHVAIQKMLRQQGARGTAGKFGRQASGRVEGAYRDIIPLFNLRLRSRGECILERSGARGHLPSNRSRAARCRLPEGNLSIAQGTRTFFGLCGG